MSAATVLSKLLFYRHASGKVTQTSRTIVLARALVWHFDGQQRPLDGFDPHRAPVRTIERDGCVLAIYSVGNDDYDNGGDDKADLVWWLKPDSALPGP